MGKEWNIQRFSVQQNRLSIYLLVFELLWVRITESLSFGQIITSPSRTADVRWNIPAYRDIPDRIPWSSKYTRQTSDRNLHYPKAVRSIEILVIQHTVNQFLSTPWTVYIVIHMSNVMTRLIAMRILAYQSCDISRGSLPFQLGRNRKQGVQLSYKASSPPIKFTSPGISCGTNQVHCHAVPSQ